MATKRLRVGAVQLAAQAMDAAESVWPRIDRWASEAAAAGCELVVFPECSYPAYVLGSSERARGRDVLGRAAIIERLGAVARTHGFTLIAGFSEDWQGKLWNSAGVWDRTGRLLGIQRKTFLFDCDNLWFSHGPSIEPVATDHGRIGIVICADARAPEVSATLVNRGAELIVVPTAWVNMAKEAGKYWNVQPDCLIRARAMEFGVPYVCADKCGSEPPLQYVGQSQIVERDGRVRREAGPAEEACIVDDIEFGPGRPSSVDGRILGILKGKYTRPASASDRPPLIKLALEDLKTYPAVRAAALEGARFVVFPEVEEKDFPLLRTRAAENRIFVGAGFRRSAWMAGPDGRVIELGHQNQVDPALADDKRVTPLTDIFEQRRPELYQFEPS